MTTDPNQMGGIYIRFFPRFEAAPLLRRKGASGSCPSVFGVKRLERSMVLVPGVAHTFDLVPERQYSLHVVHYQTEVLSGG